MAENNFAGVIDSLMKGMSTVLSTKTVVGEATKIGDTIILPLVDVTFGVGAGASVGDKKNGGRCRRLFRKADSQRRAGDPKRQHQTGEYQKSGYRHQGTRFDPGYCRQIHGSKGRND